MDVLPDKTSSGALSVIRTTERYSTIRVALRGMFALGCCYYAYSSIAALAGQATSVQVNAALTVLADMRFAIALTLAGGAGIWAAVERKIRQNAVERLHERIKSLETAHDPARSSSQLTSKGRTNPKDKA